MRYRVILADPPWGYGDKQTNRKANYRGAGGHGVRAVTRVRVTVREISGGAP